MLGVAVGVAVADVELDVATDASAPCATAAKLVLIAK